ncbi:MAG: hypothetical protein U1E78_08170 [Gammaproteobacteria bacterium]
MDLKTNNEDVLDENFLNTARAALKVLNLNTLPETRNHLSHIRLEKLKALKPRDVQSVSLMLKQDKYIADIQKAYNFLNTHFDQAAFLLHSIKTSTKKESVSKHG